MKHVTTPVSADASGITLSEIENINKYILASFTELGSYNVSYEYISSNHKYGYTNAIQLGELGSIYINDDSSSGSFTGSISSLQQRFSHLDYGDNNAAADLTITISNM